MSWILCRRSLCTQRRRVSRSAGGVSSGNLLQSGSALMMLACTWPTLSPPNSCVPVSISYSTQPKAQMSVRLSTTLPRACSGLMYRAVPISTPTLVSPIGASGGCVRLGSRPSPVALASPKSSTFRRASGVILMLAGLRSRCTIPRSCAASSASVSCAARSSTSAIGRPRRAPGAPDGSPAAPQAFPLRPARGRARGCRRSRGYRRSSRCSDD